jgi:hypothetical protein
VENSKGGGEISSELSSVSIFARDIAWLIETPAQVTGAKRSALDKRLTVSVASMLRLR